MAYNVIKQEIIGDAQEIGPHFKILTIQTEGQNVEIVNVVPFNSYTIGIRYVKH